MNKRVLLAAVGSLMLAAGPVLAQGHGGGGHGGGGHSGGGHAAVGHAGGAHFASAGHYAGGSVHAYGAAARGYGGYGGGHAVYAGGYHGGYGGAYGGYHGGYHGYSTGAYWRGGYWHGGYWPRAYYGLGYAWFLPVLPLAYATYWYGGIPYYYANDVYYTWNPSYEGYVATDPPPVADPSGAGPAAAPDAPQSYPQSAPQSYPQSAPQSYPAGTPPGYTAAGGAQALPAGDFDDNPTAGDPAAAPAPQRYPVAGDPAVGQQQRIFMYPKNGQSQEQQSIDKRECQQWAAQQAGQGAANGSDYQRAMVACVEGRGYSAN